jgi:hypothetical protein
MRRALMTIALLLALPGSAEAASPATVKVVGCVPALDQGLRSATFEARMRASRGSDRMQVRFMLQVRDDALLPRWRRVVAPGFDLWLSSDTGVRRYTYDRTVQNLKASASYRTVVRFRWLDDAGRTLRTAKLTSGTCRQPDMRPNLVPLRVDVVPGAAEEEPARYLVTLRNAGRTAAGPFAVALDSGPRADVLGVAAGETQVVTLTGPACAAGAPLSVTLDPDALIDERVEHDNVLDAAC